MKERNLELKVGFFVLAGLAAVAMLVVAFGKFGNYLKKTYPVVVEFQDARDILKNSKVLWRGAQIGVVADTPTYHAGEDYVELTLKIDAGIEIPTGSKFRIDQYGMLGDRFVRVVPPETVDGTFLAAGARVKGEQEAGLNAMMASAGPALDEIRSAARRVDEFAKAATGLVQEAEKGKGPLYTLMKDEKMASDMKALMANLRRHGVLFYSDDAAKAEDEKSKKTDRGNAPSRAVR
ncbi:MAG: MCE family protein [Verrucomicrobia bacterium]|nr:MCE family protein [Verrucomicrobiota bacterium]NBR46074.1 MCE family protein [Verrucomicrobiota bacterium]NBR63999.1 MCE family protein [Verrucomicrobiota bacterium]NBU69486.1 MCE family protein [Verrucomicrobiota bacterium]